MQQEEKEQQLDLEDENRQKTQPRKTLSHHITLKKRHPIDVAMASEGPPSTTIKSKSTPF